MFDSSGQKTATSTIITAGNTTPTVQVIAPAPGTTFAFGDTLQYKVVVTDPEESAINCNDVQVTFVLGHDSHGHAEQTSTGCTGFLQTIASDVTHGGNVFGVISAQYADKGGSGGQAPSLTRLRAVQRPPEAPRGRVRHQPVRHVDGDQHRHDRVQRCRAPRRASARATGCSSTGRSTCSRSTRSRSATRTPRPDARRAAPLAAVDLRQDSITGPVIATANLTSTGGTGVWSTMTVPVTNAASGAHELFLTFRTVTGGATGGNLFNLNWAEFGGNGVTVQSVSTPGDAGGTRAGDAGADAGHAGGVRPVHAGRRARRTRVDHGQRHLDGR